MRSLVSLTSQLIVTNIFKRQDTRHTTQDQQQKKVKDKKAKKRTITDETACPNKIPPMKTTEKHVSRNITTNNQSKPPRGRQSTRKSEGFSHLEWFSIQNPSTISN
jgi:hypothetical protein